MIKISIDSTPLGPQPSGVGFHVAHLIAALQNLQEKEDFQLSIFYQPGFLNWLFGRHQPPSSLEEFKLDLETGRYQTLWLPARISNPLMKQFPELLSLCLQASMETPDVFHGTNYTTLPWGNSLKVMNIYDVTFLKYPDYVDSVVATYEEQVRQCLKYTDLVITSAESSKQDIAEYLNFDPDRICVTSLASRYSNQSLPQLAASGIKLSKDYILFVSTLEPRKNIPALIQAFNHLKSKHKIDHCLFLVGRKGWSYDPIFNAINQSPWRKDIYHLGYLPDELVVWLYTNASVFAYPSYYEGFGLPILEAMTLGAPVVTSNTSSLPEVAGDAALLVDPNDWEQLAEAILRVISDTQLRHELVRKGKERAKLYSWHNTALETLKIYRRFL